MGLSILFLLLGRATALTLSVGSERPYPPQAATAIARCVQDVPVHSLGVVLGPNLPSTATSLLQQLHAQSIVPILLHANVSSDFFVLITNSKDDAQDEMSAMKNNTSWNPRCRYVVVLPAAPDGIVKMFGDFQMFKVFNVVVVYPSNGGLLKVASFDPFKAKLSVSNVDEHYSVCNFFPNKFLDLNKTLIRASVFPLYPPMDIKTQDDGRMILGGWDGNIFNTMVHHLNAVAEVSIPADGDVYGFFDASRNRYTGALGDVVHGNADIAVNSRFLKPSNFCRYLYPHGQDDLVVIVPKSLSVPQYRKLFLPFAPATWMGFAVCVCAVAACWFLVFKNHLLRHEDVSIAGLIGTSAFQTYRSLLTGGFSPPPSSTWVRAFLGVWLLFSLVMINAFQGSLIGYLALPKFLPEMETLEDVRASGLTVAMYGDLVKTLPAEGVAGIAMHRFYKTERMDDTCAAIAFQRNTTLACNEVYARYTKRKTAFNVDGVPLLHVIKQRFRVMFETFAVPTDSPLAPRLDTLMQRMLQAGLPGKWKKDILHDATLRRLLASASSTQGIATPLSLAHLQTGFFLLAGGLLASLLAFAAELLARN